MSIVKGHWIPILLVNAIPVTQSRATINSKGDGRQPCLTPVLFSMAWSSVHYLPHAQEKKQNKKKNKTKQKHKRAMMMVSIFLRLGHMYFDFILFQMSKLHYCFPFSGERCSVKMFWIDCKRFLFFPPPPHFFLKPGALLR